MLINFKKLLIAYKTYKNFVIKLILSCGFTHKRNKDLPVMFSLLLRCYTIVRVG